MKKVILALAMISSVAAAAPKADQCAELAIKLAGDTYKGQYDAKQSTAEPSASGAQNESLYVVNLLVEGGRWAHYYVTFAGSTCEMDTATVTPAK